MNAKCHGFPTEKKVLRVKPSLFRKSLDPLHAPRFELASYRRGPHREPEMLQLSFLLVWTPDMDKKKAAEGLKVHGICKNEYFVNFCLCFLLSG